MRRSRASVPATRRIHFDRSNGPSVRLSVVLSTASSSPSAPCVIGPPALARACSDVNCVIRSPVGRSAASYSWVTARAARRRLAQAQGSEGSGAGDGKSLAAMPLCICSYFGLVKRRHGALVAQQRYMYIHVYERRVDRRSGRLGGPSDDLVYRRVAPLGTGRARVARV